MTNPIEISVSQINGISYDIGDLVMAVDNLQSALVDIQEWVASPYITSPNGTKYYVTIDDDGMVDLVTVP